MNEATPELRSRIHDNFFRISVRGGEYDRARDSIGKAMYEADEASKSIKKEDDALLAKIMKIKNDTEEIIKRIKDKDLEPPTPREEGAARSDFTTSSGVSDDLREEVRRGFWAWW
jgi:hypothetical protein